MKLKSPLFYFPVGLFLVLWLHGSLLGLTDDEAYYWVLSRRLDWGYAFHPPAMAWSIAFARGLFGWLFGPFSESLTRLPAALMSGAIFWISLSWLKDLGITDEKIKSAAWLLLSFAGVYGASWMIVPDMPLMLGLQILFLMSFRICHLTSNSRINYFILAFGAALTLLSKYSGILGVGSAGLSLLMFSPRSRKKKAIIYLCIGLVCGILPILFWNSQHQWASILYQIQGRHEGAHWNFSRYLRFWIIQVVIVGPGLFSFVFRYAWKFSNENKTLYRFIWIWSLPAALVFWIQPAWSDFKAHWSLVAWFPFSQLFAWRYSRGEFKNLAKIQIAFGLSLIGISFVLTYFPLVSLGYQKWTGKILDPRLDIGNDMRGWNEIEPTLRSIDLPIIGSRYQTASQAAFYLRRPEKTTLIPRDIKAKDEWPDLQVSNEVGPQWPKLEKPVLFIADNRYSAGPEFMDSKCEIFQVIEAKTWGMLSKKFTLWKCVPNHF